MSGLIRATSVTLVLLLAASSHAQSKPASPKLVPESFIVLDSVVTEQWPAMLPAVNAPEEPAVLNPGQCVRVGVAASGIGSEHFLDGVAIHAVITAAGAHAEIPLQPSTSSKLLRPEGADFVEDALAAGGLRSPLPTTGVLSASASKWCVPLDASDGKATFSADVELSGKHTQLKPNTIRIESLTSAPAAT